MAILKIARIGHPVLRMVAQPVAPELISSPEFQRFCDDLLETMEEYDGAGLAAPQVHVSMRVVGVELSSRRGPEVFVNPVIEPITEELGGMWEGCLSVPDMRGAVARPRAVRLTAVDRHGEFVGLELEGLPAIIVQHECDHLDGVLFVDRMDPRTFAFLDEYRRFGPLQYDDDGDLVLEADEDELEHEEE